MTTAIVNNRIRIMEPTEAMFIWAKKNLVLDNPDYFKKLKMGKWTGGTPEYIYLYEKIGSELMLPFGCLKDFYASFRGDCKFRNGIAEKREVHYRSDIKLFDYQQEAVNDALAKKNGVIVMPCGSGKTQTALHIISEVGGRCLWLTHTQDLLNQSMERAKAVLSTDASYGRITGGKVDIGEGITFATVQTMSKLDLAQYKSAWDIIVVDECMPGNTLIDVPGGKKELKDLRIDDIITSYNRNTGEVEDKRITHIFKSKAHDIVKVKLSNDEEIVCTDNHPIFTQDRQWIDAERLVHDDYVLRLVRKRSRNGYDAANIKVQDVKAGLLLLFKRMFGKRWPQKGCLDGQAQEESIRNNEKHKQSVSRSVCRENENKQSIKLARSSCQNIEEIEGDRSSSENQMREWNGINCSATNVDDCACADRGSVCGISDTDKDGKRFCLSDLLQGGYSNSKRNDCNRGGWKFSLCNRTTRTGYKERAVLEWVRVDSVKVQKQTSDGTFGGLCEDGYVYNIEVEDNNNYFANGILVHNCQHCCGSPTRVTQFYKVVNSLSARYKFGLTATPKRADGLEQAMFALLGGVIHTTTKDQVAHTTCPIHVKTIETGYVPDYNAVLLGDGTIDYSKLIENMVQDEGRFKVVMDVINNIPHAHPTMVLANRVSYLEDMRVNYEKTGVCLSGMSQSKKAKAERKETLEKLNNGEIDCIFCTYQLAAEGLDVPNLRYVVFATPEKDPTRIQQASGRVGRKADGKQYGTVIDFVDNFGMYRGWHKKRLGYYKKLNYEVIE